jgi:hypothetical protein
LEASLILSSTRKFKEKLIELTFSKVLNENIFRQVPDTPLPSIEYPRGDYPTYITQESGKVVPVVQVPKDRLAHRKNWSNPKDDLSKLAPDVFQAYCYTKYLGQLKLKFDSSGDLLTPVQSEVHFNHFQSFRAQS